MSGSVRKIVVAFALAGLTACGGSEEPESAPADADAPAPPPSSTAIACQPMPDRTPLEGRASPYDSVRVSVDGQELLVCYGRPSSRNRTMIGGENVPYGELWRTGANEPTTLHIPFAAEIAGIAVEPGSYSLYTIPNRTEWTVIVNRSTTQWGEESSYTDSIRALDVGRAAVPAGATAAHVETFTITSEPGEGGATDLVLEWEGSRIEIPLRRRAD
jgi:hypothetical protein